MENTTLKKILVPVDFSKTAHKAFHHVKFLAQKFSSEVVLMHVEEEWPYAGTFPFLTAPELDFKIKYNEHATQKLQELKNELLEAGISKVHAEIVQGGIAESIGNYSKDNNVDLVIMGTHGSKGISGFLIGSNAYKVVNFIDAPVLTINEKSSFGPYKNIIAPLDDTKYSRAKFPYIAKLAATLDANIEILYPSVNDSKRTELIEKYFKQVSEYLEKNNIVHTSREVKGNFAHEVVKFAEYTNADLVIIMSDSETTISNMLMGTFAHEVVNHCVVPVITLHHEQSGALMDIFG